MKRMQYADALGDFHEVARKIANFVRKTVALVPIAVDDASNCYLPILLELQAFWAILTAQ